MATHSSILAWRIPWTEEPGGLQSMVYQKSRTRLRLSEQLKGGAKAEDMGRPGQERPPKVLLGLIQFNYSPTDHEMANHTLRFVSQDTCITGYMPQLSNHSSVSGDPGGHSLKLKLLD